MVLTSELDPPTPATDRTLFELLAAAARRTPTVRLADFLVIGAHGALGVAVFATPWWLLAMPLTCLAAIDAWGLAERKAHELDASQDRAATPRSSAGRLPSTARWRQSSV